MGSLSFLNPVFLIALPAAGIPILIHLINRRRAKRIDFAAIDFVLKTHKRLASSWRLRQILLLIARVAVVLFLVLSFARPYLTTFASRRGPVNLAVIVDNSYSMQYRHGDASSFERAVQNAQDLLRSLHGNDNAALILGERSSGLTSDLNGLIDDLTSSPCSHQTTDIAKWLSKALDILGGSTLANKHIALLTDMAEHGWEADRFADVRERMERSDCTMSVVDVGADGPANAAVADAQVAYGAGGKRRGVEVVASIANFGDRDIARLPCELFIDEKSAAVGFADVPAGSRVEKRFTCEVAPGTLSKARLEIGPDSLAADNVRYLLLDPPPELKVLLVDGSPGTHRIDAETFYLERALRPDEGTGLRITPVVVTTDEMKSKALGDYDVVFLCNISFLPASEFSRVHLFLEHGGGLFVSLGDMADDQQFNATMGGLISRALWDVKATSGDDAHIAEIRADHPALKVFDPPDLENLRSAVFKKLYLLRPGVDTSTQMLMSLRNGVPVLIESRCGAGRVMLFTSSVDRAWNDLPIKPTFLPLMHQVAKYLGGVSDVQPRHSLLVGEAQELSAELGDTTFEVVNPKGEKKNLGPGKSVIYHDTLLPGIYDVTPGRPFAVNVDTRAESNLKKISADRLKGLLGDGLSFAKFGKAEGQVGHAGIRTPIWGKLLAALVFLILTESVLARKA